MLKRSLSIRHSLRKLLPLVVVGWTTGCFHLHYLSQAVHGQLDLATGGTPIKKLLQSDELPPLVRNWLSEVSPLKTYIHAQGLNVSNNYTHYVQLDRPAAVWLVVASEPMAFIPKVWTFPWVGSFPYLGWFKKMDAQRLANELSEQGWDVYVRGAGAYSTLGWFSDPLISTMIDKGGAPIGTLVNTLIHESVHATIHIPNQGHFNESSATFIADTLAPQYLEKRFGNGMISARYEARRESAKRRLDILQQSHSRLKKLYASNAQKQIKITMKNSIYADIQKKLKLKTLPNNATLVDFQTYRSDANVFEKLWQHCSRNMKAFGKHLGRLSVEDFPQKQMKNLVPILESLLAKSCYLGD
jgi:predicted aminopeptidase